MADANNKLRLQIVTQLDAAGIKATKEQVDQLELGLRRAGNAGGESGEKFGQLEKALGKLPGPIGKIGGALGGMAGKVTMAIGAFTTAFAATEGVMRLYDASSKLVKTWFNIRSEEERAESAQKNYEYELKNLKESLDEVTAAELKRMDATEAAGEKALKRIDEQTAAYFRQASALQGLTQAGNNAKLQQLEREKYENMRDYSTAGYTEAAGQVGKYYDTLIAEEKLKQTEEQVSQEMMKLGAERTKIINEVAEAKTNASIAANNAFDLEKKLKDFRRARGINGNAIYDNSRDAMLDDHMQNLVEKAWKKVERADAVMEKRSERLETIDAEELQKRMELSNALAEANDNVLHAADAYDDFVNGNPNAPLLGSDFGTWGNDILKSAEDSYRVQDAILSEVRAFSAELKNLLVMGGGE